MALSDFACKNAKAKEKPFRLSDGGGRMGYPTHPRGGLGFSGPNREFGLAACSDFISSIGTLLPMAP